MPLQYIDQADLKGKKVLARFDFNVPLKKETDEDGDRVISDPTRIDLALETIQYILNQGASKLILMSHHGRPKGKRDLDYSLAPVAKYLAKRLDEEVTLTESALDRGIKTYLGLNTTKVILLENLRFHPEEEANDSEFARVLSTYGDVFVNDAFGALHRKHASTYQIIQYFKNQAYGGFLLKREIDALSKVIDQPESPFVALLGGAKVSDKIKIIDQLLPVVDQLLIGGAMAYPFLKAKGHEVGKSLCQDDDVTLAQTVLGDPASKKLVLPVDHVVAADPDSPAEDCNGMDIPEDRMGLDIGLESRRIYKEILSNAKTVFWNGPMGLFENSEFSTGTFDMAKSLSNVKGFTLVGGGDSVAAVKASDLASKMDHVSTGGGASLEFIEKGQLPGIQALKFGVSS